MPFKAAFIFINLLWVCIGQQQVAQMTLNFADKFNEPSNLQSFYAPDALLEFDSDLPFGGKFHYDDIDLFWHRFHLAFQVQSNEHKLLAADEAAGTSILQTTMTGRWTKTGAEGTLVLLHVLEFDQLDNKIETHLVINKNIAQTLETYRTAAESALSSLYWSVFRSNVTELYSGQGEVWDKISDDIHVRINMWPEDLENSMDWQGKNQVLEGMKRVHSNQMMQNIGKSIKSMSFKVLYADSTDIWVKIACCSLPTTLVHYTFKNGLLTNEELTLAAALRPWQIHPFPFPVSTSHNEHSHSHAHPAVSNNVEIDSVDKFTQIGHIAMSDVHIPVTMNMPASKDTWATASSATDKLNNKMHIGGMTASMGAIDEMLAMGTTEPQQAPSSSFLKAAAARQALKEYQQGKQVQSRHSQQYHWQPQN